MVADRLMEDDGRRPGCGSGCRRIQALLPGVFGRSGLFLHDPDDHEWYGETVVRGHGDPSALIVTGRLVVDLARLEARVDDRDVRCTPNELRVLRALARRVGRTVEHATLLADVWSVDPDDRGIRLANAHLLRVTAARLRHRLGPASTLLVTVVGIGYRLEMAAAGVTLAAPERRSGGISPFGTWARGYQECAVCGTTDQPHKARGYCTGCYERLRRLWRHRDD